ncbi:MAG: hypothetical protein A3I72_04360 [Candidatus Tectomicrobia bacterium RIFCSPLOWO2_02_FULL_70_19]|nr:MAG: hypothetical protein A3I72_04360 [Candidatus Tectomicrobia bacterium RIFCSPLOWO2_02_FULL_70_19]
MGASGAFFWRATGSRQARTTSSMLSTKATSSPRGESTSISRTSFSFSRGSTTRGRPPRRAARSFSFTAPTARTRPRRVTSPLMAASWRTLRPVRALAMARAMVMPAEGPSLGTAPSGRWMWMSRFSWKSAGMPSSRVRARSHESAAWALSFITSPSLPVRMSWPLPSSTLTSTGRSAPPEGVQASPVATPTPARVSGRSGK